MTYTGAERVAAVVGMLFGAVVFLVSLDVASGGMLTRRGRTAYAWSGATESETP